MAIRLTLMDILRTDPYGQSEWSDYGWARLLERLAQPYSTPDLSLEVGVGDILMACGYEDARCWLDAVPDMRNRVRLVLPAVLRVLPYTDDDRVHRASEIVLRWLGGDAANLDAAVQLAAAAAQAARAAAMQDATASVAAAAAEAMQAVACCAAARAAAKAIEASSALGPLSPERLLQVRDWMRLSPALHRDLIL